LIIIFPAHRAVPLTHRGSQSPPLVPDKDLDLPNGPGRPPGTRACRLAGWHESPGP